MSKHSPQTTPSRTVAPTPPAAKRPPNSHETDGTAPSEKDEGWEKARPKDTGRGGA